MRWALLFSFSISACGLTVRGSAVDGGGVEPSDEGGVFDAGTDAGADVVVEDADAGPCSVEVNDAFTASMFDPMRWTVVANAANVGFPKPVVAGTTNTASFIDDQVDFALGAIWHPNVVPFEAFDIAFDAIAVCTTSFCGDGLAIAWLEAGTTAQLQDAQAGNFMGLPKALSGGAVALDLSKSDTFGETAEPAMTVLDIDSTKIAAPYAWVIASSADMPALKNNGTRRIDLKMRANTVTVKVDGVMAISGALPHLPKEGLFGFAGASGSYNSRLAVGDVRATFYRCNAP